MKLLASALAALALAGSASAGIADGVRYVRAQQNADGGFGEPGERSDAGLTAWAVLGLRAAGAFPTRRGAAADFLLDREDTSVTDLELRILALDALGRGVGSLADRLAARRASNGRIGPTVNSTIWGVLALRAAGRPAGRATVRWLLRRQRPGGGWSWAVRGRADSNDTAAAIQALRAAGVSARSRAVVRGARFLRRLQNGDGGFELTAGRGSDAQSTAWAIQALVAARRAPGAAVFGYLRRLQRSNGSFRYSARYAVTPAWVTAQALPALARRPYPVS
ncbi:MAG TPA: prenyltransferase/squalene oxidase repeat-containing protein [Gaiellaceae bacterium]|nr:prenyltransferase/squalene oxidase repeat-containing protein [Gaiellaceae bacterium]